MNHRATNALDATILDVRIEQMADEEHALATDFEADQSDWREVEETWSAAGAPGGYSAAFTQRQEDISGPPMGRVIFMSDAGIYSDDDRTVSASLISSAAPVSVLRLPY
jgi:hypothetical protein